MLNQIKAIISVIVIIALVLGSGLPFGGQLASAADGEGQVLPPIKLPGKGNPKLDSQLNQLVSAQASKRVTSFAKESNIEMVGGDVRVIVERLPDQSGATTKAVSALGVVETSYDNLLQVVVPIPQLSRLADTPGIRLVRLPWHPLPAVVSEGVGLINADDWQNAGYTGAGVKVGILDGGFSGYTTRQSQGELPASVTTWWAPSIGGPGTSVHGTACAEIVYDIAPAATFYLANFNTEVEMGNAVNWLIAQGVNVISCSMGWPVGGPGDGTGTICGMVNNARAAGIVWSQAIGNSTQRHWQGNFIDANTNGWNDFATNDETNTITVNSGNTITVTLKWDDTWGSSANDYDLFLLDSNLTWPPVAGSTITQDGNDDPLEGFSYTATYTGVYHIAIGKYSATRNVNFHLYSYSHDLQYQVASSSFGVPADSSNAMAVGAVDYTTPTTIESFSSQGPTKDGRVKPDLVAPDGVSTVTYGASAFHGTSASAPHVAGAAVLVKKRYPSYTPAQIQAFLEGRAVDLGAAGKDNIFGSGRLDLGTPPLTPPSVTTSAATNITSGSARLNGNLSSVGTATNVTVSFEWGLTTSYGNTTTPATTNVTGPFSFTLPGLSPSITYHFRAKAVGDGTVYGSDATFTTPTILLSLDVTPANPNIALGRAQQFTATGRYSDNTTGNITTSVAWTSDNTTVATIGSTTGRAQSLAEGTTNITATLGATSNTTLLTVGPRVLDAITVTPVNPSLAKGRTQQFTATGTYSDNSTAIITTSSNWTSSDPTKATVGINTGIVQGLATGSTNITATQGAVSGSSLLTITAAVLDALTVTPINPSVPKGRAQQFTATGRYSDNTTDNITSSVTWVSDNITVATISTTGRVQTLAEGTTIIRATQGSITDNTTLTVGPRVLDSIAVTPTTATVPLSRTRQFTAIGTYSDNLTDNITATAIWASSNLAKATINATGLASTVAIGSTFIMANKDGVTSNQATLTISTPVLDAITVTPVNPSVAKGRSQQFTAMGRFSDNATANITTSCNWTSSDPTKATIVGTGLAQILELGATTITATFSGTSVTTTLTITDAVVDALVVTPVYPVTPKGTTIDFQAWARYSDGIDVRLTDNCTWASSNLTVATILNIGTINPGRASALNTGTTNVTATYGATTNSTILTVDPPTLSSIAINEASPSVAAGRTLQLYVTGTNSDNTTSDLTNTSTWASSNRAKATISTTGLVTGISAGSTNITATNNGLISTRVLTVTAPELVSIAVTPVTPTATVGNTVPFAATGRYSDNSTQNLTSTVTWTTSDNNTASITTTGLATGLAQGTTNITATSGLISDSTTLTVTAAALTAITVTPVTPTVTAGDTVQFTATGHYSNSTTANITTQVTWSSSNNTVATIAAGGLATGLTAGSTNITATLGAVSGATTLNVTAALLTGITVTPANPSVAKGRSQQFTATGTFSDALTRDISSNVTWTSSNTTVAIIAGNGLASSLLVGSTNITTTSGAISGDTTLTVTPAVLVSIAVTPATPSLAAGNTQQFTATGTYSDNSTANLTSIAIWTSSSATVAGISTTGLASSTSAGTTTITATSSNASGTATLTVTAAVLNIVWVTPVNPTIVLGGTQTFRAMGQYSDGTMSDITTNVTWTSGTPGVATISAAGLATGAGAGTSLITATLSSKSANTTLTVKNATLTSIAVTPATQTFPAGSTQQYTATSNYSDSSSADITALVTWSSSNTAVARINTAGLTLSYAPGSTNITAASGNITSPPATLTVTAPILSRILVTPSSPTLTYVAGTPPTMQFTATAIYSDNSTTIVTTNATWSSSNPAVATIDAATGLATTAGPGSTNITATQGALSDNATLTVLPDTVPPVVRLTSPTEGMTLTERFVTISGNVNDVSAITTAIINGGAPVALSLDGTGNFSQGVMLNSGANTILVRAVDGVGNTGTSGTVTVLVDPNRPTITISQPADHLLTNNRTLTVRGTVTNATTATMRLNGAARALTVTGGAFSDNVTLVEGTNFIAVNAYATGHDGDAAYLGTSGTRTVTLDTTPPGVILVSPSDNSVISTPVVAVSGTVNDPSVATVLLILNGGVPQVIPVASGIFSQHIMLVPGNNTIAVSATDQAGNQATAGPITVTLDNTRPRVIVTSPANRLITNSAGHTVIGALNDPAITTATLYLNSAAQAIPVAPDGSFRRTVPLISGANTIEVRASDNASPPNTGSSGIINVTVDTTAPVLTLGMSDPTDSITFTASSNEALIAPPTVNVVNGASTNVTMTLIGVNRWAGTYGSAASSIATGDYVVTITGIDRAGNMATKTGTFTKTRINVDGVNPTTVSNNTTRLNVETNGAVTNADITVTQHMENPSGAAGYPAGASRSASAFVEVNASPGLLTNLRQIYIRVSYNPAELPAGTDESSLRLYLWDTTLGSWSLVPGSGVNTTEHFIYGTASHLSKFGGFGTAAAQQTPPPPPPASGGGGGGIGIVVEVTGLSGITSLVLDATGACQGTTQLTTADNVASLYIRVGFKMHDAKGKPLGLLKVSAATSPPTPPAQTAIIAAYNFDPAGATFNPAITLIMTYDPAKLPKGAKESELYLASSNGTEWQALESTVDTTARTVSAKVSHFTQFALMSKLAPASFALSAFSVTPTQVKPDEMVTIQTVVTNNGGSPGKYNAVLKVNGAEVNNRELVLSANKSETAVFKVKRSIPGKYTVDVNGNTGEFTVTVPPAPPSPAPLATPRAEPTPAATPAPTPAAPQPTPGPNWALIWGIGGVVVAGAILWLVIRRRFMA